VWTFTFTGSGKNKYANELLELACNFEYEFSEHLQEAIKNNWLCNLLGFAGCWFPMDLLQEKHIKQLKKMSQRRDASFGGSFFRNLISYNIRAFLDATTSMKTSVRLSLKGGSHKRTKKLAGMNKLMAAMEERELHKFRAGRKLDHVAQDDFEVGYMRLEGSSRIKDFITRTLQDNGNIHGDGEDEEGEEDRRQFPRPNVLVDGDLVLDDEDDSDTEPSQDTEDMFIFGFGDSEREDTGYESEN
jgi:hypothetical protein